MPGSSPSDDVGERTHRLEIRPLPDGRAREAWPIEHYTALGNGRSVSLVAPDGTVEWWCVPSMDSPPLFDCLLDREEGGYFQAFPDTDCQVERAYRPDSNVMETICISSDGIACLTQSLNSTMAGRLPWSELACRLECLSGTLTFHVRLVCGTQGGTVSPWLQPNPNGSIFHVGSVLAVFCRTENVYVMREDDRGMEARVTLREGERATVALIVSRDEPLVLSPIDEIDTRIDISDRAWRAWAEGVHHDGPHTTLLRRHALLLKLLLYSPSGAIAAAATTSLPEKIGGNRNYDYRYGWIRDAGYAVNAFLRLSIMPESDAAFAWLMQCLDAHGTRVLYSLDGNPVADVQILETMAGYMESRPVVTGNAATRQHQHGIYGDIFETASLFVSRGNVLDQKSARTLSALADECADKWQQKDAGIWELETPQHYTQSKISAWQALTRATELASGGHLPATCAERWGRERDRIAMWIDRYCWSESQQAYTMYAGSDRLDAALALGARFGFGSTQRMSATLDAIRRELGHGALLYRYSGTEKEEGAFLACSFWMCEALAELGRQEEGERFFEACLDALPPTVGILAEMIDPLTGHFLGNIPQGLSHLALIHAACSLAGDRHRSSS
ncbi:glycoside hydrolase family 15 protein [Gluconacetobacter tumulisoli]|uniref:Glycoside hydrolase family 15 protein n=2 Tax=Gluconacetobacter tumulisoli TaxID=1286189 RepID=A0A7W4KAD6_9PROT|nr:glycoside hydrolase family 15 protein [Gluconacetobacter tumulisoli]